jgi:hypothetical protein
MTTVPTREMPPLALNRTAAYTPSLPMQRGRPAPVFSAPRRFYTPPFGVSSCAATRTRSASGELAFASPWVSAV